MTIFLCCYLLPNVGVDLCCIWLSFHPNDSQVFCLLQGLILLFRKCFLLLRTFHFLSSFLPLNVHPVFSVLPWLYLSSKLSTSSELVMSCLASQKRNSLWIVQTRAGLCSQDGGPPHRILERTEQTQSHREWKGCGLCLKYSPEISSLNDWLSTYGIPGRWNSSKRWFLLDKLKLMPPGNIGILVSPPVLLSSCNELSSSPSRVFSTITDCLTLDPRIPQVHQLTVDRSIRNHEPEQNVLCPLIALVSQWANID